MKLKEPQVGDTKAISEMRKAILGRIGPSSEAEGIPAKGWPVPYAVRRFAWHVLDHAWEIRDKS